ncbi:thioredoxin family protein [Planctomicrobium piriforme]|uniref:Thioredoxin 2 n=1 Tax=Planctomicrobium piriforme TaxID=1576369 RepID=A0A1I3M4I6_9PLAN|nr:thioredoxin family protein [Planctomicrobium piriforme]SFI91878.1 thioredoxin 2 [Planctomicrobium piriforme]
MKYVNAAVAVIMLVIVSQAMIFPVAPPDDPWFKNAITNYPRPVLVKFGADWCPPCRHMEGVLDDVAPMLSGRVKVVRIDIDRKPELAQHYGVSGIPQVFLFDHGKVIARHGGFGDAQQVKNWVDRYTK